MSYLVVSRTNRKMLETFHGLGGVDTKAIRIHSYTSLNGAVLARGSKCSEFWNLSHRVDVLNLL